MKKRRKQYRSKESAAKTRLNARNRNMAFMVWWKEKHNCKDCKENHPHYVMDLDHVYGKKVAKLSRFTSTAQSAISMLKEISKCEVVCANCHRERTYQRRAGSNHLRGTGRKKVRRGVERPPEDLSKLVKAYARWRDQVYKAR